LQPVTVRSSSAGRLLFVDRLRAAAALGMIETHVFNTMLFSRARSSWWFVCLDFVNGLIAPTFLFVAGFVFVVSSSRKLEELRAGGVVLRKALRRIFGVWLIAYLLHIPRMSIKRLFQGYTGQEWLGLYRVDVLHCICFTWLFLLLSLYLTRSEQTLRLLWAASMAVFSLLAPLMWSIDFLGMLPAPAAAYLNNKHYSLFPLFPWSAFMLAGALCASCYQQANRQQRESVFMAALGCVAVIAVLLGYRLPQLLWLPGGGKTHWAADPRTFLLRLGLVLALLCAFWVYGLLRNIEQSWFLAAGRESLFIYVGHLIVLYLPVWRGSSLAYLVARRYGVMGCTVGTVLFVAVMVLAARTWSRLKQKQVRTLSLLHA